MFFRRKALSVTAFPKISSFEHRFFLFFNIFLKKVLIFSKKYAIIYLTIKFDRYKKRKNNTY